MSKNNPAKKAILDAKILWHSLFHGMGAVDDILTKSNKTSDGSVTAEQKLEQDNVYASLVKGEITQEVKDLRYETYQAARKASEYQYIGGGTAVKKNTMLKNIDAKVENEDNLKVVLVQANHLIPTSVYDAVEEALHKHAELPTEHRLKIERKYYSRFKIEDYATQLVVKESPTDKNYILDFYVPIEPVENQPKAIYFSQEVKSVFRSKSCTSDILDIDNVSFITEKAYPVLDMHGYSFKYLEFLKMIEYNGSYIIRYYAIADKFGTDEIEEFNDKESVRKFEAKEPRPKKNGNTISLADAKALAETPDEKVDVDGLKKLKSGIKFKKEKNEDSSRP